MVILVVVTEMPAKATSVFWRNNVNFLATADQRKSPTRR